MMKYEIKKNYMPLEEVREMIEMDEKLEKDYMDDYTRKGKIEYVGTSGKIPSHSYTIGVDSQDNSIANTRPDVKFSENWQYTPPDSKYIPNGGERLEYPAIPQLPEDADKVNYVLYSDKGQMVWITINDFLMKLGIREMIQKITEEFE
jgi:hypothetical protein